MIISRTYLMLSLWVINKVCLKFYTDIIVKSPFEKTTWEHNSSKKKGFSSPQGSAATTAEASVGRGWGVDSQSGLTHEVLTWCWCFAMGCELWLGQGSLESGLHPPQLVLDPPRLSLAGLLEVGIAIGGQEVDVRGGEPGGAPPKVGLQLPVRAVGTHSLLEGVDLTHNLRYAPWAKDAWMRAMQNKRKSENMKIIYISVHITPEFPPASTISFVCDLIWRERG